ncbi:Na+/H+ antiporter subunit D [Bacilli bacterium]|nr:monovalent cation/H+ antiporter subunit D [Bacilli bacterium VT-13-104]PZD86838.1 Na+/H+ antiporter subunit D [Bacilli bacterium]PZD88212.1 Na+/H+ antiporter subunit D [Bacilli bacterium]PZD91489.1 Na+/H+ antiporter subunit D [Bacilli bacterium]RCO06621.1 Na+/H+ antiporter subunit D [Bacilli bacterium]
MNNLVVLPMVIPVLAGILFVFFRNQIKLQRWISFIVMIGNIGIAAYLLHLNQIAGIQRIDFSGWMPPFGISFVADSFALILVLLTSLVAAICLIYAFSSIGEAREKMYFYSFVNFLVAGVNGSFLTGDLFNLYVCFEIMLLASYVLIALGGEKVQLRESIKYVLINVLSSWFFLVAIAYLYGAIGTLNMAHISERIAESGQTPLLTVISIVFLTVFALKAGLLLYFWLPGSYSIAPTAVAALFGALLTKVGIYAMIRVFTLFFYHDPSITHTFITVLAALTLIGGSIGAVAYKDIRLIVTYNVVIAVGFILVGLAVATPEALEGSIYYLMHDMIVKALLFLLAGTMISVTGTTRIDEMSGLIRNYPLLGWMFFIVMLSLAGVPPLSGFIGKVLVGQGTIETGSYILLALAFLSSIFVLYSLLRVFLQCFWGETIISSEDEIPMKKGWMIPCAILTIGTIVLGLGAEFIFPYVSDAANTLLNPSDYIDAVLTQD